MDALNDTLTEIIQYFTFDDLINFVLTNKKNYNNIFTDSLFCVNIYELSLMDNIKTLKFIEKITKKIFVKKLIINVDFCENILFKFDMKFLEILNLSKNIYITDKHLNILSKFCNLKVLQFGDCKKITNDGLKCISKLYNLKELNLYFFANIRGNGLEHICKLNNLNILHFSLCVRYFSKIELECLSNLYNLKELHFCHCCFANYNIFEILCKFTGLKILNMQNTFNICNNDLEILSKLSNLEELNISSGQGINKHGIAFLLKIENLKTLNLPTNLKTLELSNSSITDK